MAQLTLIRHAPLPAEEKLSFIGTSDIILGSEALVMLTRLRAQIQQQEFKYIYSSPLSRAFFTARHLFPTSEIIVDDRLKERSLGKWEGQLKLPMRAQHPEAFFPCGKLRPYFTPPEAESIDAVVRRADQFVKDVRDNGVSAVAVTHNGTIRVIRSLLEARSLDEVFRESEPHLEPRTYYL